MGLTPKKSMQDNRKEYKATQHYKDMLAAGWEECDWTCNEMTWIRDDNAGGAFMLSSIWDGCCDPEEFADDNKTGFDFSRCYLGRVKWECPEEKYDPMPYDWQLFDITTKEALAAVEITMAQDLNPTGHISHNRIQNMADTGAILDKYRRVLGAMLDEKVVTADKSNKMGGAYKKAPVPQYWDQKKGYIYK